MEVNNCVNSSTTYVRSLDNHILKESTSDHVSKNIGISVKAITLVFNVGPSFFHLLCMNKNTGRTFNYLFDSCSSVTFNNKTSSNSLTVPLLKHHQTHSTLLKLNGRSSIIKLNVFREKCICEKCLSASYIFFGSHASDLRSELLRILSCGYCKAWDLNWIKILIEQMQIFFCCVSDGVVYERLLESASLCAKMLLIRNHVKDLIEIKYGYQEFLMNFLISVEEIKKKPPVKRYFQKVSILPFIGTGKEVREVIDGVNVVSFRTEADMNEYTQLELRYLRKAKSPSPVSLLRIDNEIIPTKTTDITKIKGWRNKLFSSLECPKDHIKKEIFGRNFHKYFCYNSNDKNIGRISLITDNAKTVTKRLEDYEKDIYFEKEPEIKLENKTDKNLVTNLHNFSEFTTKKVEKSPEKKMCISSVSHYEKIPEETTEKILEVMAEKFLEEKVSKDIGGTSSKNCDRKFYQNVDRFPPDSVDMKSPADVDRKPSEEITNAFLACTTDKTPKKLLGSPKDNIKEHSDVNNDITPNKTECGNRARIKNSAFESDALDEFLKNNSRLNISYEIPTLVAADRLTLKKEIILQNKVDKTIKHSETIKPEDIKEDEEEQNPAPLKQVTIKEETQNYDDLEPNVKENDQKNVDNTHLRYIWVQGRPIQVVSGIKEEDMITTSWNCKVSLNDSEFQEDSPTEVIKTEPPDNNEVDNKRPRLLTRISDEESDFKPKKFEPPSHFGPCFIPIIHGCIKVDEWTKSSICHCKRFSLCMTLTIGKGRCLSKDAIENLEKLRLNDTDISERMASIACCALATNRNKMVTRRVIVPVVSDTIVNTVKNWEQRLAYDMMAQYVPSPSCQVDIDPEVRKVMNGILDYAELKLNPPDIPYDPMYVPTIHSPKKNKKIPKTRSKVVRELRRLINVSIIDESYDSVQVNSESNCGNEFCIKGCICNSLNSKINFPLHCEKLSCLFRCSCPEREIYDQNVTKANQSSDVVLAKEEITWHQTVIRSEDGDRLEFMNSVDKSKREKKLPTRYRNDSVVLGKEMHTTTANALLTKTSATFPEPPVKEKCCEEGKPALRGKPMKMLTLKRRLGFCSDTILGKRSLADVFIWCGIHDKYNCLCVSWICRLKHNAFIWKPEKTTRYLPLKMMAEMELKQDYCFEVFVYDTKRYSARTYGAPIEYAVRNRSEMFLIKRKYELENGVISCTNSYIKMKFFMVKDVDPKIVKSIIKDSGMKEVFKSVTGENVYIKHESNDDKYEEIIIDDTLPPIVAEPVVIDADDSEVEEIEVEEVMSEQITTNCNPITKISTEITVEEQAEERVEKNCDKQINIPGKPSKPTIKPPIKSYARLNKFNDINSSSNNVIFLGMESEIKDSKKSELNEKKKKFQSEDDILTTSACYRENGADTTDEIDRISLKKIKTDLHMDESAKSGFLLLKDKVDTELENDLIKLEEHPLREQINGVDNLPKHALLCLTPGIGFLPILEYNPNVLAVQDPAFPDVYHSFKNLESANIWLNRFFKNRLIFETIDTSIKWVIVKPGIIKLKQSPPFSPALLENPSIIVTKDGGLIFRKKDHTTGGICRGAIKVEPLTLSGTVHQVVAIKDEHKRKLSQISLKETVYGRDGKRRKIQWDTGLVSSEHILKRPINIFQQFPSMKIQESLTGIPFSVNNNSSTITPSNNCNSVLRKNVDAIEKKMTPVLKSSIRPLIVTGTPSGPIRVQVSSSGITNLCPRSRIASRSLPLSLRNEVSPLTAGPLQPMVNSVPLTGTKIISHDGRPVIIHNNTIIPINLKNNPQLISKAKSP